MPSHRVFPLGFTGNIIGSARDFISASDHDALMLRKAEQDAGDYIEVWCDVFKAVPRVAFRSLEMQDNMPSAGSSARS